MAQAQQVGSEIPSGTFKYIPWTPELEDNVSVFGVERPRPYRRTFSLHAVHVSTISLSS
jgi:hypothetical protein